MNYKEYNSVLLKTIIFTIITIIALNYLVNPYNIFKQRIFKNTLLKPEAKIQERITKPLGLKIDNRQIDAVFFGTSRADLGLDKEHYKTITGKEAENIAIGGLLFYEMFDALNVSLKIHPEIKHIYIGLDYGTFLKENHSDYKGRVPITKNPKIQTNELAVALLCTKTTGNSIWTIIKNFSGNKKRMFYASGKKYIFVNKKIKKEFEKAWIEYNKAYIGNITDLEKIELLRNFYNTQKALGREVTLFIMPSHVTEFYFIYKTGSWNEYIKWKKALTSIAPVYDFQYPNKYTKDTIKSDMQTFFDASHCTYVVGNKIIEDIVLNKGNFARLLTQENVDQYLQLETNEIIQWKKENKETVNWINNTVKEESDAI